MKTIQVLGTGCTKCVTLENNIKVALEKSGIQANVEKVTDVAEIASFGIMGTPWFVVDGKVLSVWKVLEVDEIIALLEWWEVVSDNNKKEEKTSCCASGKKDTQKSWVTCDKNWCGEKIISAIRIALITMLMTALFTYMHQWTVMLWLQNWGILFFIALISMCFIIRPFIIQPLSEKVGEKKGKWIGLLILIFIMSFIFTYKFHGFEDNFFMNEFKNFGMLIVIVIPLVFIIINPILKLIFKK